MLNQMNRVAVEQDFLMAGYKLYAFGVCPNGDTVTIDGPVQYRVVPEKDKGFMVPDDQAIRIGEAGAQMLLDSLWAYGVRPSSGVASAGQAEAMVEHINDLRMVVKKSMGIK